MKTSAPHGFSGEFYKTLKQELSNIHKCFWKGKNIFPQFHEIKLRMITLFFFADLECILGFISILIIIITTTEFYWNFSGYSCLLVCFYDIMLLGFYF